MIYKIFFASLLVIFNILGQAHSTEINTNTDPSAHRVTIKEKTVILMGKALSPGQAAPDFKVVDEQFNPVKLSDFSGKVVILSIVPSIDTGICSLQTKRFNDEVTKLQGNLKLLTISADLPFAQKRFCIEEEINNHQLLSDSVWRDFGMKYGLLIKNMGLLSRAVLIIDEQGVLKYQQIVPELSKEPDYDEVLNALKKILPQPVEGAEEAE